LQSRQGGCAVFQHRFRVLEGPCPTEFFVDQPSIRVVDCIFRPLQRSSGILDLFRRACDGLTLDGPTPVAHIWAQEVVPGGKTVLAKLGLEGTNHKFRHSFCTIAVLAGVDFFTSIAGSATSTRRR